MRGGPLRASMQVRKRGEEEYRTDVRLRQALGPTKTGRAQHIVFGRAFHLLDIQPGSLWTGGAQTHFSVHRSAQAANVPLSGVGEVWTEPGIAWICCGRTGTRRRSSTSPATVSGTAAGAGSCSI